MNLSLVLLDSLRGNILSLCLGSGDAGCSGADLTCFGVSTCFGESNPSILAGLPASLMFCMRWSCEVLPHSKRGLALWRLRMPLANLATRIQHYYLLPLAFAADQIESTMWPDAALDLLHSICAKALRPKQKHVPKDMTGGKADSAGLLQRTP
jgi:hypothetical protein